MKEETRRLIQESFEAVQRSRELLARGEHDLQLFRTMVRGRSDKNFT